MPTRHVRLAASSVLAGGLLLTGCGTSDGPEALEVRAFYSEEDPDVRTLDPRGANLRDEPGHLQREGVRFDETGEPETFESDAVGVIDATRYVDERPAVNPGVFFTVGGVIARVNGRPIYTDDVLERIEPVLAARARELDLGDFERAARAEITRELEQQVEGELVFAAAERNLSDRDKRLADALTAQWRDQQITEAGGSEELARQRAREQTGMTFDQVLREQNRLFITRLYFEKRLLPRVTVTATELRSFYDRNRDQMFFKPASASWRVVRLDADKHGSLAAAQSKAADIVQRVRQGHDFKTIATEENDHPLLRDTAGSLGGPMRKGTFAVPAVDEAAWQLAQGEVSEPVTVGNQVYVAWMEDLEAEVNRPFGEPAVQQEIRETLRRQRFLALREEAVAELRNDAYITRDEEMVNTAVDVALQNYADWRNGAFSS